MMVPDGSRDVLPLCAANAGRANVETIASLRLVMALRDLLSHARVISHPVSVLHGMFEESKSSGGDLLLFENIIEAPGHRAVLNLLTRDRLCTAIGIEPEEFIESLAWAMNNPGNLEFVDTAPCREVSPVLDLSNLPIPHHYPQDRGRYMSASIVIAEYNGIRNVSFHRQFLRDSNHLVARLVPRHLRTMVDQARELGEEVSLAIVNSPDPVVLIAAAMSFDDNIDELKIADSLHRRLYASPLGLHRLPNGVPVPADSEYVMWGAITTEDDYEGPYVDITGTLDGVRQEPVIRIDGISHRENPIFHALIPAEQEHKTLMGLPRTPTIKEAVSKVCDVIDVHMSAGGCGWLSAVVSIDKRDPTDGKKAIDAALAGHRSMKMVTVVDGDIEITDPERVEWAMMTRWQPDTDTVILSGQKGSSLDPSRSDDGTTSKVGFDATIPMDKERSDFLSIR